MRLALAQHLALLLGIVPARKWLPILGAIDGRIVAKHAVSLVHVFSIIAAYIGKKVIDDFFAGRQGIVENFEGAANENRKV